MVYNSLIWTVNLNMEKKKNGAETIDNSVPNMAWVLNEFHSQVEVNDS